MIRAPPDESECIVINVYDRNVNPFTLCTGLAVIRFGTCFVAGLFEIRTPILAGNSIRRQRAIRANRIQKRNNDDRNTDANIFRTFHDDIALRRSARFFLVLYSARLLLS